MKNDKEMYELIRETSFSIYPIIEDITYVFEEYFTERRFFQSTFLVYCVKPKPLTPELYCKRRPYINPISVNQLLVETKDAGFLKSLGKNEYMITESGTAGVEAVHDTFYKRINEMNEFPQEKLKELIDILSKLVKACSKVKFNSGNVCFNASHYGHPKTVNGTLAQVDQLLDDINAFRDDAHIESWIPMDVSGHTWEVLTFIWNGEANTVEKLVELLPFRNYDREDYVNTLENLTQRGWIQLGEDGYLITDQGKAIRDYAEADTNKYFFLPWKELTDAEVNRLSELLNGLKETNLKLVESNEAEQTQIIVTRLL